MIILRPLAKLIHVIRHCLNACIRRALSACREDAEEPGKENTSVSLTQAPAPARGGAWQAAPPAPQEALLPRNVTLAVFYFSFIPLVLIHQLIILENHK